MIPSAESGKQLKTLPAPGRLRSWFAAACSSVYRCCSVAATLDPASSDGSKCWPVGSEGRCPRWSPPAAPPSITSRSSASRLCNTVRRSAISSLAAACASPSSLHSAAAPSRRCAHVRCPSASVSTATSSPSVRLRAASSCSSALASCASRPARSSSAAASSAAPLRTIASSCCTMPAKQSFSACSFSSSPSAPCVIARSWWMSRLRRSTRVVMPAQVPSAALQRLASALLLLCSAAIAASKATLSSVDARSLATLSLHRSRSSPASSGQRRRSAAAVASVASALPALVSSAAAALATLARSSRSCDDCSCRPAHTAARRVASCRTCCACSSAAERAAVRYLMERRSETRSACRVLFSSASACRRSSAASPRGADCDAATPCALPACCPAPPRTAACASSSSTLTLSASISASRSELRGSPDLRSS
mmetsp:Transcript_39688/g.101435  ORF Transcript_39688/g.101435 Transcript_39688/m.101435 type:complete len:426 (+) Transcript_39688:754-2031(+)